ncbi:uncharacterized protein DS421_9g263470 [Arachis hypogaea]|nr:uncharacterized protein DS421_9g263470 [Arachis hypogaea]
MDHQRVETSHTQGSSSLTELDLLPFLGMVILRLLHHIFTISGKDLSHTSL